MNRMNPTYIYRPEKGGAWMHGSSTTERNSRLQANSTSMKSYNQQPWLTSTNVTGGRGSCTTMEMLSPAPVPPAAQQVSLVIALSWQHALHTVVCLFHHSFHTSIICQSKSRDRTNKRLRALSEINFDETKRRLLRPWGAMTCGSGAGRSVEPPLF